MAPTDDLKTPENLARLPPKLRERLQQRGIISKDNHGRGTATDNEPVEIAAPAIAPRTVYSAPPVLNSSCCKRALESPVGDLDTKRCALGVESPASLRAAVAAKDGAAPPVWVFSKDSLAAEAEQGCQSHASVVGVPVEKAGNESFTLPLPPGWVAVPHEGDVYYWNTATGEVSWDHPGVLKKEVEKPKFTEEYKVLWSDVGRIIGRQGFNLKVIKASIGCDIRIPRSKGKGKGKSDSAKASAAKDKPKDIRGAGTGEESFTDDQFTTVFISAESAYLAKGGLRCLQVMLGYGRNVERALTELGVEVKLPPPEELKPSDKDKNKLDPVDPASYSNCPVGTWSSGLPKHGISKGRSGGQSFADSKEANNERC